MKGLWITLGLLLSLQGCSGSNTAAPGTTPDGVGLRVDQGLNILGIPRSYHLYLPTHAESAPIVMLLHGNGGSNDQLLGTEGTPAPFRVWLDIASRENVILLLPDGLTGSNDNQGWNDCRSDAPGNPQVDDVLFLQQVLLDTRARYGNDDTRIFVTGISNGGGMAMRLADEIPELLDGMAVVAASRAVNSHCPESTRSLPVLFMNGTNDPILPYEGGQIQSNRGEVLSTPESIAYWVNRNRSNITPSEARVADTDQTDRSSVVRFTYSASSSGAVVEHVEVVNGGHTEPSATERYSRLFRLLVGEQNGDIEMAEVVWQFFDALQAPAL